MPARVTKHGDFLHKIGDLHSPPVDGMSWVLEIEEFDANLPSWRNGMLMMVNSDSQIDSGLEWSVMMILGKL